MDKLLSWHLVTVTLDAGSTFKIPEVHFRSVIVNAILSDLA